MKEDKFISQESINKLMSVQAEFQAIAPPLRWDEVGGIRIGESRVTLDSFLAAYNAGSTPEEIAV